MTEKFIDEDQYYKSEIEIKDVTAEYKLAELEDEVATLRQANDELEMIVFRLKNKTSLVQGILRLESGESEDKLDLIQKALR